MLVTAEAQVFTLAEWQELFSHVRVVQTFCLRCAERGWFIILEHGRCPRCFENWEEVE